MSYLISLGFGFAVGLLYWIFKVQSPAPPLIALAGLLGMVIGEHAIPIVKAQLSPPQASAPASSVSSVSSALPPESSASPEASPPGSRKTAHSVKPHPARLMAKDKFKKARSHEEV
jgi:XapX domain-containing protein